MNRSLLSSECKDSSTKECKNITINSYYYKRNSDYICDWKSSIILMECVDSNTIINRPLLSSECKDSSSKEC